MGEVGDAVVGLGDAVVGAVVATVDIIKEVQKDTRNQFFRFTRELLGNAADMPECSEGLPIWVAEQLMSDNAEVKFLLRDGADGNAAVLLCMGTDPENPALLQVKAAANRGYGFPVVYREGVVPVEAGISSLEKTLAGLLNTGAAVFFDSSSNWSLSPSEFVYSTQEFTATFDEQNLRDAAVGRIIEFELPNIAQVLVSSTLKLAWEEVGEGDVAVAGLIGAFSMVQNCDFTQVAEMIDPTEITVWTTNCASALDERTMAAAIDVASEGLAKFNHPKLLKNSKERTKIFKKVLNKLKFLIIFSTAQTVIDYMGDWLTEDVSSYPAWYAQVVLKPEQPKLESMYGQYDECGKRFDATGIWQSQVGGVECRWGAEMIDQQSILSTEWNGSCFTLTLQSSLSAAPQFSPPAETWYICPARFGGDGDDTRDRIGLLSPRGEVRWLYRQ